MEKYIGTKIINAQPKQKVNVIKDGNGNEILVTVEGYEVIYEDGYTSWSPKDVFEKAYRKNSKLSFEMALFEVKQGKGMRLSQWKPDVVIRCQKPDKYSKMTAPYLYVESRFGRVPWKETMIELFAENWEIVD